MKHKIKIQYDENPLSPRKDRDNLGRMVCWHRRYHLGDEQPKATPGDYKIDLARQADPELDKDLNGHDYEDHDPEDDGAVKECIEKALQDNYVVLDLYLYDHSGITMSTSPFGCPWDSGQVGFIYASMNEAEKLFEFLDGENEDLQGFDRKVKCHFDGHEEIRTLREATTVYLQDEVSTYDSYLRGDIWEFFVLDESGMVVDSGSGYDDESVCRQDAEAIAKQLSTNT